jgi:hypothetical protein
MKYKDLTEEEILILNMRRAGSEKYVNYLLWLLATKEIKTERK